MPARTRSPRFDALETRTLLSAASARAAAHAATPAVKPSPAAYLSSVSTTSSHGRIATLRTTYTGQSIAEGDAKATLSEVYDTRTNGLKSATVVLQTSHGTVRLGFNPSDVTLSQSSSFGNQLIATYRVLSGTGVFARGAQPGTISLWSVAGSSDSNMSIAPANS